MTRDEWINYGIKNGWCTDITCITHDMPIETETNKDWFENDDVCMFMLQLLDYD